MTRACQNLSSIIRYPAVTATMIAAIAAVISATYAAAKII